MAINDNFNLGGVVNSVYTYSPKWIICWYCSGDGERSCCYACTSCKKTCTNCGGSGKVRGYDNSWPQPFTPYWGTVSAPITGLATTTNKITLNGSGTPSD